MAAPDDMRKLQQLVRVVCESHGFDVESITWWLVDDVDSPEYGMDLASVELTVKPETFQQLSGRDEVAALFDDVVADLVVENGKIIVDLAEQRANKLQDIERQSRRIIKDLWDPDGDLGGGGGGND